MPTVTFQVAAEESLGSASLYLTALPAAGIASRSSSSSSSAVSSDGRAGADGVDVRGVFDSVAMVSLVGIVRQLAQLSDHTAAVFESLSAEVADVGRRRAAIVARVAEVEARLSRIELRTLRDTQPVRLVYAPGGETRGESGMLGRESGKIEGVLEVGVWRGGGCGGERVMGIAGAERLWGITVGLHFTIASFVEQEVSVRKVAESALEEEENGAPMAGVTEGSSAENDRRDDLRGGTGKARGATGGKEGDGEEEGADVASNHGGLAPTPHEPALVEPSPHKPPVHEPAAHEPAAQELSSHVPSPHTPAAHEPTPYAYAQGEGEEWGADDSGARKEGNPVVLGGEVALDCESPQNLMIFEAPQKSVLGGEAVLGCETPQSLMVGRGAALGTAVGEMVVPVVREEREGDGGEEGGEVGEGGKEVKEKEEWVGQQERHFLEEEEEGSASTQRDDVSSTDLMVENGSVGCEGTRDEDMSLYTGDAGEGWDEEARDEQENQETGGEGEGSDGETSDEEMSGEMGDAGERSYKEVRDGEEMVLIGGGGGLLGGSFGEWQYGDGEVEGGRTQRVLAAVVLTCGLLVDGDADDGDNGDNGIMYGSRDNCYTDHNAGKEGQVDQAGELRQVEEEQVLLTCPRHSQALQQGVEEKDSGAPNFAAAAAVAISADFSPAAAAAAAAAAAGAAGGGGAACLGSAADAGKSSAAAAGGSLMRRLHGHKLRQLKPWLRPDKLPLLSPSSPLSPQADEGCISPPPLALPLQAVEEEPVHVPTCSRSGRTHAGGAGVVTGITMFRLLAKGMGVFTPRQDWTVTGGAKAPKVH
ncbi:unnamed protein product [Closterium sp. Yama58-4]|nr:unnamed protein product [Closterium sp. Yama58-4]